MIDWVIDPSKPIEPEVKRTIYNYSYTALLAGRFDLWLEASWPESGLPIHYEASRLLAPQVSVEQTNKYLSDPRIPGYLNALRLPEYWDVVGWPDICKSLGEGDFECQL
jgi:hypothetical protein